MATRVFFFGHISCKRVPHTLHCISFLATAAPTCRRRQRPLPIWKSRRLSPTRRHSQSVAVSLALAAFYAAFGFIHGTTTAPFMSATQNWTLPLPLRGSLCPLVSVSGFHFGAWLLQLTTRSSASLFLGQFKKINKRVGGLATLLTSYIAGGCTKFG